jgi:hypothetical protein
VEAIGQYLLSTNADQGVGSAASEFARRLLGTVTDLSEP